MRKTCVGQQLRGHRRGEPASRTWSGRSSTPTSFFITIERVRSAAIMSQLWGRREFIRVASLGPLGLGLGDYLSLKAQSQTPAEKSCIMVVLDGGMSHHDTFDMKLDAPSEIRGTFKPIATNVSGIQICEHLPKV